MSDHKFDVFVSYSREDERRVGKLEGALEKRGFRVFRDVKLRAGDPIARVLDTRIRESSMVLVVWSAAACKSRWVESEAAEAYKQKKYFPVCIEPLDVSALPLDLRRFTVKTLADWAISGHHGELEAMVENLVVRLKESATAVRRRESSTHTPRPDGLDEYLVRRVNRDVQVEPVRSAIQGKRISGLSDRTGNDRFVFVVPCADSDWPEALPESCVLALHPLSDREFPFPEKAQIAKIRWDYGLGLDEAVRRNCHVSLADWIANGPPLSIVYANLTEDLRPGEARRRVHETCETVRQLGALGGNRQLAVILGWGVGRKWWLFNQPLLARLPCVRLKPLGPIKETHIREWVKELRNMGEHYDHSRLTKRAQDLRIDQAGEPFRQVRGKLTASVLCMARKHNGGIENG